MLAPAASTDEVTVTAGPRVDFLSMVSPPPAGCAKAGRVVCTGWSSSWAFAQVLQLEAETFSWRIENVSPLLLRRKLFSSRKAFLRLPPACTHRCPRSRAWRPSTCSTDSRWACPCCSRCAGLGPASAQQTPVGLFRPRLGWRLDPSQAGGLTVHFGFLETHSDSGYALCRQRACPQTQAGRPPPWQEGEARPLLLMLGLIMRKR